MNYKQTDLRSIYPKCPCNKQNDDRFGGFLVPFIAGAAISAPFWFIAGNNKQNQPVYYQQPIEYYPYPVNQYYPQNYRK